MSADLLARLWLTEPDPAALARARVTWGEAFPAAEPEDLAPAWTDLFLLNVYPYGSVFTDPSGELHAGSVGSLAFSYESSGYAPPGLSDAGAPDHVGLVLGFAEHLRLRGKEDPGFFSWMAGWVPVCALAVEREPWAHPFYRALARVTREWVFKQVSSAKAPVRWQVSPQPSDPFDPASDGEIGLADVAAYLLAPARCGLFLSRAKLGDLAGRAGLRLPFGSRLDVARGLFSAAGERGEVAPVLSALEAERSAWEGAIAGFAAAHPSWSLAAATWLARLEGTKRRLREMSAQLDSPLQLEYGERGGGGGQARPE